ncbi:MAG: hypothetical protein LC776_16870 [Acidobacteria bacterium]|nr:hypothetical protein [Acidobacteriota bacterium]
MGFSTVFINRGYVHYVSDKFIGRVNAGLFAASICIGTVLFGAMWHVGTVWGWIGILLLVFYFLMIFDGTGEDYLHPSDFDPHSVLYIKKRYVKFGVAGRALSLSAATLLCWWFYGRAEVSAFVVGTVILGNLLGYLIGSLWTAGLQVQTLLALRGHAPWRLTAFLDDAHKRGVLRQTGTTYQFRHALLHDRLTTNALKSIPESIKGRKKTLISARASLGTAWLHSGHLDAAEAEYRAVLEAVEKIRFGIKQTLYLCGTIQSCRDSTTQRRN